MRLPFIKMNGAGNDFVILDARQDSIHLTSDQVRSLASRVNHLTKGCDQLIVMENPALAAGSGADFEPDPGIRRGFADVFMRIYNADGNEVNACGNATRCVGWLIMQEKNIGNARVQTHADTLPCEINLFGAGLPGWKDATGLVTANMGMPKFGWQDIPLSQPVDTLYVPLDMDGLHDAVCVSMGNPHVVFLVPEVEMIHRIEKVGAQLQRHPLFPQGVNVSIACVSGNPLLGQVTMRVWERGVGLTASCGTAACAVKVAAVKRELLNADKYHALNLQNPPADQTLMVRMDKEGHVLLHGPVQVEFQGMVDV